MWKVSLVVSAFVCLYLTSAIPAVSGTLQFNEFGEAVGIKRLKVANQFGQVYYDIGFTDLGQESVSFEDVFGAGPVQAVRNYRDFPPVGQGTWNLQILSRMHHLLQAYDNFNFPPINSNNDRVMMLLVDTPGEAYFAGIANERSSSSSAYRFDQQFTNLSFAIITPAAIPLPPAVLLLLAGLTSLLCFNGKKRGVERRI